MPPGAGVAVIGGAHRAFWARLSRMRVIAEVPARTAAAFWAAEPATQQAVIQALAQTGAQAVVTLAPPARSATIAWERVGQTEYFVHWCRPTQ